MGVRTTEEFEKHLGTFLGRGSHKKGFTPLRSVLVAGFWELPDLVHLGEAK